MSSERLRDGFVARDRRAADAGHRVSAVRRHSAAAASAAHQPGHGREEQAARWQPQSWPLRTKLLALTVIPLTLALVLGALRIADTSGRPHTSPLRDSMIIGAVLLVTLPVLVMLARSILNPLRALDASGVDFTDQRLPAVLELLRTTNGRVEDIRIGPRPGSADDDGQVARAFDAVQSEVARLAAEQQALRANVNHMFVNLSRRSQSLVERQLALIDELELSEQDPDRLAALFRLDHLATRMRRNGENLLVLADAELRQRSGEPVPVVDVLRAAVSEIEAYRRVAMQPLPHATVSGLVVNDLVHLVAELLDNAAAYSNPESQVTLGARFTDELALTIEISDAGTGIPPARMAAINNRLATPQAVDVSVSRQMGLFVVGRLANRRGLRVFLSPHEGPGVTATVMLPNQLVGAEPEQTGERSDTDSLGRAYFQPDPPASIELTQDLALVVSSEPLPSFDAIEGLEPVATPQPPAAFDATQDLGPPVEYAEPPDPASIPDPPAALPDEAEYEDVLGSPIFEAMLSKWFTEPQEQAAPADNIGEPGSTLDGWESEADAGWQAAKAASEPIADELTAAGLPKRRPQAFLVPGSVASVATLNEPMAAAVMRNADVVRGRMSSYQQGLTRGRHAGPAIAPDELPTGDGLGRHSQLQAATDRLDVGDDNTEQTAEGIW